MNKSLTERDVAPLGLQQLLVFVIEGHEYALPISKITRIVNIVEITPLPHHSDFISGVINLHGLVVPVINIRKRLNLEDREPCISDIMLIANIADRTIAFIADEVKNIVTPEEREVTDMNNILPVVDFIHEVVKVDDKLLPVYDFEKLISLEEEQIEKVVK